MTPRPRDRSREEARHTGGYYVELPVGESGRPPEELMPVAPSEPETPIDEPDPTKPAPAPTASPAPDLGPDAVEPAPASEPIASEPIASAPGLTADDLAFNEAFAMTPAPSSDGAGPSGGEIAADQPQNQEQSPMSQLEQTIQELLSIDGAVGAAIVDIDSGMALATGGAPGFDLGVAAAGNSNVVRAKLATMRDIGLQGQIEDIMITLNSQYHLVNVLNAQETSGLFIYIALDRAKANLALARHKLNAIAKQTRV